MSDVTSEAHASQEQATDKRDLTEGPVRGHLINLSVPMVWGIVAAMSISLADAYFLGQIGTTELAAISFTFPVVFTFTTLAIGLGAGASSVVSRAIGEGDRSTVRRLATDAMILAVMIVILVCIIGYMTIEPLFVVLGAEGAVLENIIAYMRVWYLGVPFLVVPMVANNLIRATGDSLIPSLIMIASAIVNVGLDPVLIFGLLGFPALGVEGAAWASLIARAITLVLSLWIVIRRESLIAFVIPPLEELAASWRRVLSVGIPAAAGNMMNPIGIALATSFLAGYGAENVAAFGAATRIESFAAIPLLAMSAAIGPIAGQNWGRGKPDRIRDALRLAFAFSVGWALLLCALSWIGGRFVAGLFSDDATVIDGIVTYLRIIAVSIGGYGVIVVAAACCNAVGYSLFGAGIFATRMMVLYVPLTFAAAHFLGVTAMFGAILAANILGGCFAYYVVFRVLGRCDMSPARV
ncbi:MAG: MATE family efflux transporter [Pseudomonadota bacterium]